MGFAEIEWAILFELGLVSSQTKVGACEGTERTESYRYLPGLWIRIHFFADPYPAVFLNADPDPAAFLIQPKNICKQFPYEELSVVEKSKQDFPKV